MKWDCKTNVGYSQQSAVINHDSYHIRNSHLHLFPILIYFWQFKQMQMRSKSPPLMCSSRVSSFASMSHLADVAKAEFVLPSVGWEFNSKAWLQKRTRESSSWPREACWAVLAGLFEMYSYCGALKQSQSGRVTAGVMWDAQTRSCRDHIVRTVEDDASDVIRVGGMTAHHCNVSTKFYRNFHLDSF